MVVYCPVVPISYSGDISEDNSFSEPANEFGGITTIIVVERQKQVKDISQKRIP